MGFRFRRSIKIIPGIRLNVSKSGVSTSIGTRGATINIGQKGSRATVGIPGTGISFTERLDSHPQESSDAVNETRPNYRWVLWIALAFVVMYALFR